MKKLKIFLTVTIAALFIYSCEDDRELAVLDNEGAVPSSLTTPADGSSYVLNSAFGADSFETFGWTRPDYGAVLSVTSYLECDLAAGTFASPILLAKTVDFSYTMKNADVNLLLYDAGLTSEADAHFRVVTMVKSDFVDTLYSAVNTVSITPYGFNQPNLSQPLDGAAYILKEEDSDEIFETFEFDAVNYGAVYSNSYSIEFDEVGNDFNNPVKLVTTGKTSIGVTVEVMNLALLEKVDAGVATNFEFRVVATADGKRGVVQGEAITLKLTAYSADPIDPEMLPLYLVGDATLAGWVNTAGIEILWDDANQVYSVVTTFAAGGMKILEVSGQWAPQWGDDGSSSGILSYRPTEADTDPPVIPSPGVGEYKLVVDIENLTYSFEVQ